jgi:hypothetical protein
MLSVFCSCRSQGNETFAVEDMLSSLAEVSSPAEHGRLEVLLKVDTDDETFALTRPYPFPVYSYRSNRAEGRNSLHHFYDYLFGRINEASKFVMVVSDDFVFIRKGFVDEILSKNAEICMVEESLFPTPLAKYVGCWRNQTEWKQQHNMGCPCFSRRLIEVTSGFGFIADVDCWAMLLSILLLEDYGINIRKNIKPFAKRVKFKPNTQLSYVSASFLDDANLERWHELTRRQARNLYLNIIHGTDYQRT